MQELDLKTGLVIYEWHSLDHVPLQRLLRLRRARRAGPNRSTSSTSTRSTPSSDGDLLIDSRNTWAAYDVDPATGQVRWQLGGKRSSFKLGPGRRTAVAARRAPAARRRRSRSSTTAPRPRRIRSRGRSKSRSTCTTMTATLVRRYEHPEPARGRQPGQRAGAGERRLDGRLGPGRLPLGVQRRGAGAVRRAPAAELGVLPHLRPPWSGHPRPAAGAVARRAGVERERARATVYASWNGATEVASWRVLAGASPSSARRRSRPRPQRIRDRDHAAGAGREALRAVQALDAAVPSSASRPEGLGPTSRACVPPARASRPTSRSERTLAAAAALRARRCGRWRSSRRSRGACAATRRRGSGSRSSSRKARFVLFAQRLLERGCSPALLWSSRRPLAVP